MLLVPSMPEGTNRGIGSNQVPLRLEHLGETGASPPATMDAQREACALSDSTGIGRHRDGPLATPTEWKVIECLEFFTEVDWGSGRTRRC